jgi:hypothetical protein
MTRLSTPLPLVEDCAIFARPIIDASNNVYGKALQFTDYSLYYEDAHDICASVRAESWRYRQEVMQLPNHWEHTYQLWTQHREYACALCGDKYQHSYSDCHESRLMVTLGICFDCAFWVALEMRTLLDPDDKHFIADGCMFNLGNEIDANMPGCGKWDHGFHGCKFAVRYPAGVVKYTDNLWDRGDIPARFLNRFRNVPRCEFVKL